MTVRILKHLPLIFLIWNAACWDAFPESLDWKVKSGDSHYLRGAVTLGGDWLTFKAIEKIALVLRGENAEKAFVHVEMFPADHYPPFSYMWFSHVGYDWWQYWSHVILPYPSARVIALNDNAIVEYRGQDGTVERKILRGSDPLRVKTRVGTFQLLHLTYRAMPLPMQAGKETESVEVFAQTDQPLESAVGIALVTRLAELIPLKEITVYVRNDAWFLDLSGYPLIHPFHQNTTPPTKEQFQQSITLTCGRSVEHSYTCSTAHGH